MRDVIDTDDSDFSNTTTDDDTVIPSRNILSSVASTASFEFLESDMASTASLESDREIELTCDNTANLEKTPGMNAENIDNSPHFEIDTYTAAAEPDSEISPQTASNLEKTYEQIDNYLQVEIDIIKNSIDEEDLVLDSLQQLNDNFEAITAELFIKCNFIALLILLIGKYEKTSEIYKLVKDSLLIKSRDLVRKAREKISLSSTTSSRSSVSSPAVLPASPKLTKQSSFVSSPSIDVLSASPKVTKKSSSVSTGSRKTSVTKPKKGKKEATSKKSVKSKGANVEKS